MISVGIDMTGISEPGHACMSFCVWGETSRFNLLLNNKIKVSQQQLENTGWQYDTANKYVLPPVLPLLARH
jgi:hypothetical protein